MNNPSITQVVTAFVTREDAVLVLRRSSQVGTYRGLWAGVSGYLETVDPLTQAYIELEEELGIDTESATLAQIGDSLDVVDSSIHRSWRVHPFRFSIPTDLTIRLDREHVEMKWIQPDAMIRMNTVPNLFDAWCRVRTGFAVTEEAMP